MALADSIIDWDALFEVLWASLLGGVGVTAVFALAIVGATRAVYLRREGHVLAAGAYGALMLIAAAAVIAAVVFGVIVMTSKD
ncbi:MAG: hypothetical protein M3131_06115 [Actinomycetota bacterium]|nr:hypothetical protein [Actinomycetota bacterium]